MKKDLDVSEAILTGCQSKGARGLNKGVKSGKNSIYFGVADG
jgi:hypothetical protein